VNRLPVTLLRLAGFAGQAGFRSLVKRAPRRMAQGARHKAFIALILLVAFA